jgi:hypothetical protein
MRSATIGRFTVETELSMSCYFKTPPAAARAR